MQAEPAVDAARPAGVGSGAHREARLAEAEAGRGEAIAAAPQVLEQRLRLGARPQRRGIVAVQRQQRLEVIPGRREVDQPTHRPVVRLELRRRDRPVVEVLGQIGQHGGAPHRAEAASRQRRARRDPAVLEGQPALDVSIGKVRAKAVLERHAAQLDRRLPPHLLEQLGGPVGGIAVRERLDHGAPLGLHLDARVEQGHGEALIQQGGRAGHTGGTRSDHDDHGRTFSRFGLACPASAWAPASDGTGGSNGVARRTGSSSQLGYVRGMPGGDWLRVTR